MSTYINTFIDDLVSWFGGKVECWLSPKLCEYHFAIKNNDVGYYHFTVPFNKLDHINDVNFRIQLFSDYIATMRINALKWEEMFGGL